MPDTPANKWHKALVSAAVPAMCGSIAGGLTAFALGKLFPSVQQIRLVGGSDSITSTQPVAVSLTPSPQPDPYPFVDRLFLNIPPFIYKVTLDSYTRGSDGVFGLGRSKPTWNFMVTYCNATRITASDVRCTFALPPGMVATAIEGSNSAPIRASPGDDFVRTIYNARRTQKFTALVKAIPPSRATALMVTVESDALPTVADLGIQIDCGAGGFAPVTEALWNSIPWDSKVSK